jgi:hypothetical protein
LVYAILRWHCERPGLKVKLILPIKMYRSLL